MKSTRIPIDDCPHEYLWDEIAEEEYCKFCGCVPEQLKGGWIDETIEGHERGDMPEET